MFYALFLVSLLQSAADVDQGVLFAEDFDGKLKGEWKWVRQNRDEWRIRDRSLQLRSQPGGIWGGNNARNVLLIKPETTDNVEAVVDVAHEPKKKWEQAGLLWYVDDDNFVKFISEHIDGKMYAVLASEEGGRGRVFGKVEMPQANVQLRLIVQARQVTGQSLTGQWRVKKSDEWSDCGTCEFSAPGDPRFGLFTQTGPEDVIRWVRFDSFRIVRRKSSSE